MDSRQINKIFQVFDDISKLQPINNKVLLKVERSTDRMKNGLLVGDKEWKPTDHSERVFKVISIPEKIIFGDNNNPEASEWLTDIEVVPGDVVICDYLDSNDTQHYTDGEGDYRLVPYTSIYVILRGDEIIPLNGYVLMEKEYEEKKLLAYEKTDLVLTRGRVAFLSKPNKKYRIKSRTDDDVDLSVGDLVEIYPLRNSSSHIDLEYEYHSVLEKKLFLVQRWRIAGKLN